MVRSGRSRSKQGGRLLPLVFLVVLLAGCGSDSATGPDDPAGSPGEVLSGIGVMRFVQIEGGCWALDLNGRSYEPLDLPQRFQEDGLAVTVVAVRAQGRASFCQIAPLLELRFIDTVS